MGKKNKFVFFISVILLLLAISCNDMKKHDGKTPLARVNDKYLYKEDLAQYVSTGLNKEDSIQTAKNFIDLWVKRQAMTRTAELNLTEEQKDVTAELENYRMDLLIFRYKQRLIGMNLDTIVTKKQILDFYQLHEKEFILPQPAVKATFIKILKTTPNISMLKSLYRSPRESDQRLIKDYCTEHSALFNEYNNEWVYFKDIFIEIPIRIDDQEAFLKSKTFIEVEDSTNIYLVNIKNYRLKDAVAPIVFVEGNIQSMILKQRKEEILNGIENNVFNTMLDKKEIELFDVN